MTGVLTRRGQVTRHTKTDPVKARAVTGVAPTEAKERLEPPAGSGKEGSAPGS